MGLNIDAVRTGLAALLNDAGVVRAHTYPRDIPQPPCATIGDPIITSADMSDGWDFDLPVTLMVHRVSDERSQAVMDQLVQALVETLDGSHDFGDVEITRIEPYGQIDDGTINVTTAVVQVLVRT